MRETVRNLNFISGYVLHPFLLQPLVHLHLKYQTSLIKVLPITGQTWRANSHPSGHRTKRRTEPEDGNTLVIKHFYITTSMVSNKYNFVGSKYYYTSGVVIL